jgi:hypothetical protein
LASAKKSLSRRTVQYRCPVCVSRLPPVVNLVASHRVPMRLRTGFPLGSLIIRPQTAEMPHTVPGALRIPPIWFHDEETAYHVIVPDSDTFS